MDARPILLPLMRWLLKSPDTLRWARLPQVLVAGMAFTVTFSTVPAWAQSVSGQGVSGGPGQTTLPSANDEIPITNIQVEFEGTGADDNRLEEIRRSAQGLLGLGIGDGWSQLIADSAMAKIEALPNVHTARYRLVWGVNPDSLEVIITIMLEEERKKKPLKLPILYQDDRKMFRVLLNGGFGLFTDGNPWFDSPRTFTLGNPLVEDPQIGANTSSRTTWTEGYVEYGLAGITQIAHVPLYTYGAATAISPYAAGPDIFRNDTRITTNVEKLYGGFLYAPRTSDLRMNLSVGRQNFTLNDGFLVSQYGSQWNAGPRPGVYLAPRTAQDFSVLATIKGAGLIWKTFFLNPNEYEPLETNTHLLGTNLRYHFTNKFYADASVLYVPQSDLAYATINDETKGRQGLITGAGHLRWADPDVLKGVWFESELAYQTNVDYAMSAWAGYGLVGYLAHAVPWTPSLSYRYASFSGDDPNTSTFGRFDPLYSGGVGEWLQGIQLAKVLNQANRNTHRIRLNVAPHEAVNLTLDYFIHHANELNNPGGNPALRQLKSHDLGQEVSFAVRWAITPKLFFLGIASYAMPGAAIEQTADGIEPWSTLQAQLFWTL